MATTAPVVDCADRAAARARQAATTPEICIAFPTMIERRPKILRLGDKSDPFMFVVDYRSRDYRKRISVSQTSYCCYLTSECYSTAEETTSTCGDPDFTGSDDSGRVVGNPETIARLRSNGRPDESLPWCLFGVGFWRAPGRLS